VGANLQLMDFEEQESWIGFPVLAAGAPGELAGVLVAATGAAAAAAAPEAEAAAAGQRRGH